MLGRGNFVRVLYSIVYLSVNICDVNLSIAIADFQGISKFINRIIVVPLAGISLPSDIRTTFPSVFWRYQYYFLLIVEPVEGDSSIQTILCQGRYCCYHHQGS